MAYCCIGLAVGNLPIFGTVSAQTTEATEFLYLSFLEGIIDVLVLLKLLQLGLDQHLSDVHHLFHCQRQALHWVAKLLLEGMHVTLASCYM